MRLMLIDDSEEFGLRVIGHLKKALPSIEVEHWNPCLLGIPDMNFEWRRYDVLLLSDRPAQQDGLDWLREFRSRAKLPPAIILAGATDEDLAVRAIKAGAADYLKKSNLSADRLAAAIKEALFDPVRYGRAEDTLQRTQPIDIGAIGTPANKREVDIKGYRVLRKIGEGGMAKVYLAERCADEYQLVLKVLNPRLARDENFLERFLREYRIISKVQNEHVVAIYDQGISDDYAFLAMEYFSGGDLKLRIQQGLTSMGALKILMQIAKALDAVHGAGVVHRDLKPQNIMFRDNNRPALVDFGMAKEIHVDSTLTGQGMVIATPLYMSPEQCVGNPHDARGDLYSVGVILYEMLTGALPYTAQSAPAIAYQHVNSPIPRLPGKLSGYQSILDRLMAKQPEERFQSARELFACVAH